MTDSLYRAGGSAIGLSVAGAWQSRCRWWCDNAPIGRQCPN